MSTSGTLGAGALAARFAAAADHVVAARDELCALDAVAGDGDLGVTLATGFTAVRSLVAASPSGDAGELLVAVGRELGRKAPSTIGTLISIALVRAGVALRGKRELAAGDVATMLEVAAAAVRERGHVQTGQRTVLDAIAASADEARRASTAGQNAVEVLELAAAAARSGADSTVAMEPVVGRAGWLKERARGHADAGATAWAIFLGGLAEGASTDTVA